jgi:hypothetical protein
VLLDRAQTAQDAAQRPVEALSDQEGDGRGDQKRQGEQPQLEPPAGPVHRHDVVVRGVRIVAHRLDQRVDRGDRLLIRAVLRLVPGLVGVVDAAGSRQGEDVLAIAGERAVGTAQALQRAT